MPPNSVLGLSDNSPKAELFTRKSRTVYVGHLPPSPNEDDIIIRFSEFGDIEHIKIDFVDYHGINQSFTLITYKSAYGAQAALAMNKQQFLSHKIRVRMMKNKRKK